MGTRKARLVRADKGIFCLYPIGPVGYHGIRVCRRGFKGPMGRGSGGSMGGENLGMGAGVQAYGRPGFFSLLRDRCKLKKRKAHPGRLSLSRGLFKLTGRPARNAALCLHGRHSRFSPSTAPLSGPSRCACPVASAACPGCARCCCGRRLCLSAPVLGFAPASVLGCAPVVCLRSPGM